MWMPWTQDLATGIRTVDLQHKQLVNLANQIHDQLSRPNPDPKMVGDLLVRLMDDTYNHFLMEEELFQRIRYAETSAHRREHDTFTRNIASLLERHEKGEPISVETLDLLKHWLTHHIVVVDKAYVPFLVSKGVV